MFDRLFGRPSKEEVVAKQAVEFAQAAAKAGEIDLRDRLGLTSAGFFAVLAGQHLAERKRISAKVASDDAFALLVANTWLPFGGSQEEANHILGQVLGARDAMQRARDPAFLAIKTLIAHWFGQPYPEVFKGLVGAMVAFDRDLRVAIPEAAPSRRRADREEAGPATEAQIRASAKTISIALPDTYDGAFVAAAACGLIGGISSAIGILDWDGDSLQVGTFFALAAADCFGRAGDIAAEDVAEAIFATIVENPEPHAEGFLADALDAYRRHEAGGSPLLRDMKARVRDWADDPSGVALHALCLLLMATVKCVRASDDGEIPFDVPRF